MGALRITFGYVARFVQVRLPGDGVIRRLRPNKHNIGTHGHAHTRGKGSTGQARSMVENKEHTVR